MKLEPECVGCIINQVYKALKLLQPDISRGEILNAQKKLMVFLLDFNIEDNISPLLGKEAYRIVSEVLDTLDPYKDLKKKYNQLALDIYDELEEIIENSEDPLYQALIISAIGNTIDFAGQHEIDLISDIKDFTKEVLLFDDYFKFKEALGNTKNLLIIGDNAGEIVFDKLLIKTLKNIYPNLNIVYSVRDGPIINDATMEDANFIGLTDIILVVKSSATPGIDINSSSEGFKDIFYQRGTLVLSKGQGNFESLFDSELANKEVFYLMMIKCNLMERMFGAKIGDLIFKKNIND
ncbi:MAG: DUF89 domain-containing protein [Candidatus Thorarchaeota archaeon]